MILIPLQRFSITVRKLFPALCVDRSSVCRFRSSIFNPIRLKSSIKIWQSVPRRHPQLLNDLVYAYLCILKYFARNGWRRFDIAIKRMLKYFIQVYISIFYVTYLILDRPHKRFYPLINRNYRTWVTYPGFFFMERGLISEKFHSWFTYSCEIVNL